MYDILDFRYRLHARWRFVNVGGVECVAVKTPRGTGKEAYGIVTIGDRGDRCAVATAVINARKAASDFRLKAAP